MNSSLVGELQFCNHGEFEIEDGSNLVKLKNISFWADHGSGEFLMGRGV